MTDQDLSLEQLLSRMGRAAQSAETSSSREARRARLVPHLRSAHRDSLRERQRSLRSRKRVGFGLVAAAALLAGSALAAVAGVGPLSGLVWRPPVVSDRADRPGKHLAPLASTSPQTAAAPTIESSAASSLPTVTRSQQVGLAGTTQASAAPRPVTAVDSAAHAPQIEAPASQLTAVNQLFAEAKRARREHRDADALSLMEQLLARYPGSVLAQEASIERFRALARLGRKSEAQRLAKLYIAAHPTGYAVEEARRLIDPEAQP